MNKLVEIKNGEVVCDSLLVAEKFEKRHSYVLEKITQIIEDEPTEKSVRCFKKSSYIDSKNERRPMYYMNRDGFTFLVMGFTGKKANEWKWKYIEEFNKMERFISEKHTQVWIDTRTQGKLVRKSETDVIQKLVEYAKEQGSTHSEMLYMTYTKLANKMARIENGRDLATTSELNNLQIVERTILVQTLKDMERGVYYKEIYKNCKDRLERYLDITYFDDYQKLIGQE